MLSSQSLFLFQINQILYFDHWNRALRVILSFQDLKICSAYDFGDCNDLTHPRDHVPGDVNLQDQQGTR